MPTTTATVTVISTAAAVAAAGWNCRSAMPHGAFGMRVCLSSGAMASSANAYPATAPKPTWPKENTPVLPT